jgi:hypothetical protein
MSLPQNLLALCETMLLGETQRGRPDAANADAFAQSVHIGFSTQRWINFKYRII